jgi:tetratricopeptide (TPR) repeat protein
MKKIDVYLNEAEFSIKAKSYLYAAKCFNYIAKLYLEDNTREMAAKYLVKGAEIWLSLENFYEAGQDYLQAVILSDNHIQFVNNALSCFYEALTDFTNNSSYFKAGLCAKYISSCFHLLNQENKQFEHLKLAAELFVKSGMEYLKAKEYDKAILSFEYAVMCYDYLGLDLQSEQIKRKIQKYKHNLLLSKRTSSDKVKSNGLDNVLKSAFNIFFPENF